MQRTLASMLADRRASESPPAELSIADADAPSADATVADAYAADGAADGAPKERPRATPPRRIGVRSGARVTLVDVESIDWVEADGDYARVHATSGSYLVTQRMHALERLLESRDFVRIHRSLIVNVRRVRELHRQSDGSGALVLHDGVRLRVARGRWEALERALDMEEF
jgi:two-component system LytT family response regulator